MSITSEAAARVAEYVRQRDIAMSGGNVGDVIATTYSDPQADAAHLDVNDLRVLLRATQSPGSQSMLADGLRAAAARLYSYVGDRPRHWGVIAKVEPYTGPILVQDTPGDEVECVGTLDGMVDREMDLIGLMSPQTAASLSALLELLADQVDYDPLHCVRWIAEAAALSDALNRQQEWSTHPADIRTPEPDDD